VKMKIMAPLLALVLVLSLGGTVLAATPGVDEPGVAGLFIDPISDITLSPAELVDMQNNGLEIPVTGYGQYISASTGGQNPRLSDLLVKGQIWDQTANGGAGAWVDDSILINWGSTPLLSTDIRDGLKGREFADSAFSKATWDIYETGLYQVYAYAHFTAGAEPTDTEGFVVEVEDPFTVCPMAAPNIAGIILGAEGVNPQQSIGKGKNRTFINLIQQTAAHMGPQTLFDGVEKSITDDDTEVCNPDYWDAVLAFLNGRIAYYGLGIGPLTYSLADYIADQGAPGVVFAEDFTGVASDTIPAGWTATPHPDNWYVAASNAAGGTSPEMEFSWTPSFIDTSRLISPVIDAGAYSGLQLTFKQSVNNFDSFDYPYVLKVQVSLDGGTSWTDAWSLIPTMMIPAETVTVDLSAYDGQSFELAWVFSGDSFGINYWYIDDILVTGD
jgi:hypothetical protein